MSSPRRPKGASETVRPRAAMRRGFMKGGRLGGWRLATGGWASRDLGGTADTSNIGRPYTYYRHATITGSSRGRGGAPHLPNVWGRPQTPASHSSGPRMKLAELFAPPPSPPTGSRPRDDELDL